jgi:hypothetical protein
MPLVTPGTYSMAALMSEVTGDPKGMGYSTLAGNADSIAVRMNTSPEPVAVANQEQIYRARIPSSDLMSAIVLSEFEALSQARRDYCLMLFSAAQINTGDQNVRDQIVAIFPGNTVSLGRLAAAAQKNASRAEALWGDGFHVTAQQVYLALHPEEQ